MAEQLSILVRALAALAVALVVFAVEPALAQDEEMRLVPPAGGQANNIEMWRAARGGVQGTVSIPDKKAGVLVQPEGEAWRSLRNGPVSAYGGWLMLGVIVVLAVYFAVRGRIRIEGGRSGRVIVRFAGFERLVHWVTAVTFILLALSGLNTLYGRYVLKDLLGPEGFAALAEVGKVVHIYLGFVFIACVVVIFAMWIRHNLPTATDLAWLARGGGMIGKGHPPAHKFNAGQKIVFWLVVIGGAVVSYTGVELIFPFELSTTVQGMQLVQLVHAIASLVLIALIIAHIYIGSLGMEGAFEAMWAGTVDESWARAHHSLWVERSAEGAAEPEATATAPAE
jgi:formate dehydrogenase subunit gamma